ncbi:hypothetical protein Z968_04965 [Clostridium novyi A str. 4552]|uniref:Uncharacterized protein n=1 Tax=Clostridium novyi A str. 4552 TaxID=1444289 RepID=A0A0A0I7S1_CLONO|nr:DUF6143 family protein [Clostridium novyi]KGM96937.1 hypothetical protein Z968_04965 [Clostridium novyi A str. 4552]
MLDKNELYEYESFVRPLRQVVTIPNPLYKSLQGVYFIGQTPTLVVGNGSNAWAALVNPIDSGIDLFTNVLSISNFSSKNTIKAGIWLNTTAPGNPATSSSVSPSNTTIPIQPTPEVLLQYVQSTNGVPSGGVNIFDRIVPPNTTLVSEEDGKLIVPPGGNCLLFLESPSKEDIKSIVAFGWWEK